jgi:hypothetical protein
VRAGGQLALADVRHRPGGHELPGQLQPGGQRPGVPGIGQVTGIDGRPVPRVVAEQPDPAPAGHVDEADKHRHRALGRVGQALVAVGPGQHMQLQVRREQARLGVSEAAGLRRVGSQRAAVSELPAQRVRVAALLPQAAQPRRGPDHRQHWMVRQVGADARAVRQHVDAHLDQVVGRPDAGQHQQLRAVDRAAGHDDLGAGLGAGHLTVPQVTHAGGPAAFDDDLRDQGVGEHREVRLGHGRVQVGGGGRAPPAVPLGQLVPAHAVLARPVEVIVGHRSLLLRRGDERRASRGLVPRVGDAQRTARAVIGGRAARVILGPAEVGHQVLIAPAGAAVLVPPAGEVVAAAADVDHRVHRGRTAQDLAPRPVDGPAGRAVLRDRSVIPVIRALEQPAQRGGGVDLRGVVGRAGLEEQDAGLRIGGQARRQDASRASGADDDVVIHGDLPLKGKQ